VLPWFIAVQHQNPTFFREFFLEHNLERFATDRYQHEQPFWYYIVVVLLAVMPWTVIAMRALVDGIQTSVAEWRLRHSQPAKPKPSRPGDAFPEFLVLWALIPIVFFSFSQSKLPGYILPPFLPSPSSPATTSSARGSRPQSLDSAWPRPALRSHDHVCLAPALVRGPWRAHAAGTRLDHSARSLPPARSF
jgi:hypothetical protein